MMFRFLYVRTCLSQSPSDRPGMDLHRVPFPTFVLEPRSMLERIADFMSHPDLLFGQVPSLPSHPLRSVAHVPCPLAATALQRRELRRPRRALYPRAAVLPRRLAHQAQRRKETVRPSALPARVRARACLCCSLTLNAPVSFCLPPCLATFFCFVCARVRGPCTYRYNPVLGEFFRCRYDYPDDSRGFYIAEQGTFAYFLCIGGVAS